LRDRNTPLANVTIAAAHPVVIGLYSPAMEEDQYELKNATVKRPTTGVT